jgi:putative flippase GtrA
VVPISPQSLRKEAVADKPECLMPAALLPQFLRYASVGGVATACHYATLIFLVELRDMDADTAALCGFVVGGVVSYVLNRRYTFETQRGHGAAGLRFAATASVAFVLTYLLMHWMAEVLGIHYLIAQAFTTGLVLIWTFVANRFWTFSDHAADG